MKGMQMTLRIKSPLEHVEQNALSQWLSLHPILKEFYFKTNNEGRRSALQGMRLKKTGLRPGVSDIFIFYPTKAYSGLFLEVKRNKKYTPSERSSDTWVAQQKFIDTVKSVGYAGSFCYGWTDGAQIIERYLRENII